MSLEPGVRLDPERRSSWIIYGEHSLNLHHHRRWRRPPTTPPFTTPHHQLNGGDRVTKMGISFASHRFGWFGWSWGWRGLPRLLASWEGGTKIWVVSTGMVSLTKSVIRLFVNLGRDLRALQAFEVLKKRDKIYSLSKFWLQFTYRLIPFETCFSINQLDESSRFNPV